MKLQDFPWLVDENIDPDVLDFLRSKNVQVLDVRQQGWQGYKDKQLFELAFQHQAAVLTQDGGFGKLAIYTQMPMVGIIFTRPGHLTSDHLIDNLEFLFREDPDVVPPFIVVVKRSNGMLTLRVRQWTP